MKNPWVIVGIITVVLFGGAIFLSSHSTDKNNEGVEILEHVGANPEATVVLTEYSDFQCPACAAFQPVLDETLDLYGDSIRFEYKHFPLPIHKFATNAAIAAEAASQQGKFFEYGALLFENQTEWSNATVPTGLFISYADELGLDTDLFARHMKSTLLRDRVKNEMSEGRAMQITGTPTFYLNGVKMEISTYEDFVNQIAFAVDPNAAPMASSTSETSPEVKFGL